MIIITNFGLMLKLVGVEVTNTNGSYRKLGDVISDISDKWDSYSLEQKDILSEAFYQSVVEHR